MMLRLFRFNIYFLLGLALPALVGCQTEAHKRKHALASLSLHLEVSPFEKQGTEMISVLRDNPLDVTVLREPFLTQTDVSEARVVEAAGGFAISLHFDRRGQWLLEQYTAGNKGRRVAVHSDFGPDLEQHRWLAAPVISRRIADGALTFTPDASREAADQIVLGLNNMAKKTGAKKEDW